MRKCGFILLMSCFLSVTLSAQDKHDLIGRWLPQYETNFENNECSEVRNSWIINIISTDSLIFESTGADTGHVYLNLTIQGREMFMYNESDSIWFTIQTLSAEKLVLSSGANGKIAFTKMPPSGLASSENTLDKILKNSLLEFRSQTNKGFNFQVEFAPILIDSSLILTPFLSVMKNAKMRSHTTVAERETYWSIASHGSNLILRLKNIHSQLDLALVAKEVTDDHLLFEYWSCEGKELIEAKVIDTSKKQELQEKLTKHSWKLKNSKSHDSYFDMGMISNTYKRPENYHRDSTLLITDSDVKSKFLKINFEKNGTYQVYRNQRLLDTGQWEMLFDGQILKLESTRQNSEGMLGGFVFLEEITKRKLKLVRRWTMEKDYGHTIRNSDLETYKAIKK